jgi:multidrug efflux pump subunit AcrA (membrane-fusion protein)
MFSKKKKEQDEILDTFDTEISGEDAFQDEDSYELEDKEASKPPRKKLPGWVIVPVVAVFAIIIVVASLLSKQGSGSQNTSLQVSEVATGNVREVYNASGKVESENTKTYYSPVTAPITNCNAVIGNAVKSGDLLITFDTKNLERDNQQAQLTLQSSLNTSQASRAQNAKAIDAANAASAQAADQANKLADKVNNLAAQVDQAYAQYQANLAAEPAATDKYNTTRKQLQQEIDQFNAVMREKQSLMDSISMKYQGLGEKAAAAEAKDENSRTPEEKTLLQAYQDFTDAQSSYADAQDEYNKKTTELNNLTAPDVDDAGYPALKAQYEAAYAEWEAAYNAASSSSSSSGMTSSELANLEISDNLAELSALTPAELVEKGKEGMKADMDGVIASVDAMQTNTATQGMAMFTIASTEKVRVKIEVSPDDYEKIKVGNKVDITIGQYKYQGTLSKVNKIALNNEKGNPVIGAEIHIDNPDENVCIGATAKISMTVAEANDVLVVPTEVINTSSDGDFVYVIKDGVVKKNPVELGTASTTSIEIKSGLKKGDKVVNDLNVDIKEGMKATAVEKSDTDDSKAKDGTDASDKNNSAVTIQASPNE